MLNTELSRIEGIVASPDMLGFLIGFTRAEDLPRRERAYRIRNFRALMRLREGLTGKEAKSLEAALRKKTRASAEGSILRSKAHEDMLSTNQRRILGGKPPGDEPNFLVYLVWW